MDGAGVQAFVAEHDEHEHEHGQHGDEAGVDDAEEWRPILV